MLSLKFEHIFFEKCLHERRSVNNTFIFLLYGGSDRQYLMCLVNFKTDVLAFF